MNAIPLAGLAATANGSLTRGSGGSGPDCQVLVVGAGPTGLVLAAELLARGIHTRIIDKGDGVALQARAIGIHARTLEVLDTMGLAERFIERGQVANFLRFYSEGRCLVSLEFARSGSRYGFVLDLPQDETERLLRSRITELGGVVEGGTELTGLTDDGGVVVVAAVRGCGRGAQEITAEYVVGCDGAHSRVRSELGLTFHGSADAYRRGRVLLAGGSARSTSPTRRDRWSARTVPGACPESASACPTSVSTRASRPPRCTPSCAPAGTS